MPPRPTTPQMPRPPVPPMLPAKRGRPPLSAAQKQVSAQEHKRKNRERKKELFDERRAKMTAEQILVEKEERAKRERERRLEKGRKSEGATSIDVL